MQNEPERIESRLLGIEHQRGEQRAFESASQKPKTRERTTAVVQFFSFAQRFRWSAAIQSLFDAHDPAIAEA